MMSAGTPGVPSERVFTLEQRSVGAATILYLDGPLRLGHREATTGYALSEAVKAAITDETNLVAIDLRGLVKAPDSSGLGELVAAESALRKRGGKLVLVNVPHKLRGLIAMMGLDTLFSIVETEDEAIALLRDPELNA
ncbi:MAG TPA: STAS domain-containing protein [Blastocatellia bacterium]|nr:STAS domain-containing protein [Blastocatellia bacterium]